jgi:excisionase family DNA binding protein
MQAVTITQITAIELETLIENSIKKVLNNQQAEQPTETDRWLDLKELCIYHPDKPSKPTVYGWVNAGTVPVHKGGKKLRFLKSEIDSWLRQGKKKDVGRNSQRSRKLSKEKRG